MGDTAAYQYPLNVGRSGYDPRKVTNIFLTHGHSDHYGAYYEFCKHDQAGWYWSRQGLD